MAQCNGTLGCDMRQGRVIASVRPVRKRGLSFWRAALFPGSHAQTIARLHQERPRSMNVSSENAADAHPPSVHTPARPEISRFPLPMSARRARFEAERAALYGWSLPAGHPYALVPRWVPYPIARGVGLMHRLSSRR